MENYPEIQLLVFADSEVASVTIDEGNMRLLFSAAHVLRPDQENNGKFLEDYARGVELILSVTKSNTETDKLLGRIASGRVMAKNTWALSVSLPCVTTTPVKFEFLFANQVQAEIAATGLECRFTGEPNFFESMAC